MKIIHEGPDFVVSDSVSYVTLHNLATRELELFLRRRVESMKDIADAHERVPSWTLFARARQGTE